MQQKILKALTQLDPGADDQWTSDGAPRIDVLEKLADVKGIKRADVVALAPEFTRVSPVLPQATATPPTSQEGTVPAVGEGGAGDTAELAPGEAEVETEVEGEPDPSVATRAELKRLEARAEQLRAEINAKTEELTKVYRHSEKLSSTLPDRHDDHKANQRDIMNYLESQNRLRAERHARQQEILKGLDPRLLSSRSTLDQAMARKTARGTERPAVRVPENLQPGGAAN